MFLQTTRQLLPAVQVATSTSTSTAVARRNRRAYAFVQNADPSIAIRVATTEAALAGSGGKTLAAGEIHRHDGRFPLFAKAASGTPNLIVMEFVDTANPVKNTEESTVALTYAAALVVRQRDNRFKSVIENQDATFDVTLVSKITDTIGIVLAPGVSIDIFGQHEIYGFAEAVNEVQTVTVDAAGGTFTLTFDGQTTSAIAENASAATVLAALEALSNIAPGDVTVTGSTGGPYTITFLATYANTNVGQLTSNAGSLTGGSAIGTVTHAVVVEGGVATDEIQTVTVNATGGTFTLTYAGQTTSALAENAAAATVQTALEALSNIDPGDVTVTGSAGGPYTLTFGGNLTNTNVALLTSNAASLTGGPGTVAHATLTAGGSATATVSVSEALYN